MVDEVGIRYAVFGMSRLRSVFAPVFAIRRGAVVPVGVSASDALYRRGRMVSPDEGSDTNSREEAADVRRIFDRLHIHNLENASELPLDLQLSPGLPDDDGAVLAWEVAELAQEAAAAGLASGRLIFDLSQLARRDGAVFAECARMIRVAGCRLLLDADAMSLLGGSPTAHPDIVRLPAPWFRLLGREPAGCRLLSTMVEGLRRRGVDVQAEGIDSTPQLRLAIEAKVERMMGDLLGEPTLAGSAFPDEPQPVASLLGMAGNVVALRTHPI